MDTLRLLSMQTASNPEFDADDYNYEAELPKIQMAGHAPKSPDSNSSVIKTAAAVRASAIVADLETPRTFQQPALSNYMDGDKLFIAEACGNCARAYGTSLTCSLLKTQIDPLMCCSDFYSPFDIELKNA